MTLQIRLFALCREKVGASVVKLDAPPTGFDVRGLKAALARQYPALAATLDIARVAVNQDFADDDAPVKDGDEVALIPPVSGGSGCFALRSTPITCQEVEDKVRAESAGAVVSFVGTVRNQTGDRKVRHLEYEAYEGMAVRFLEKIGSEISERWPGTRTAIIHRTGRLEIGDVAVAIAVSCPHRAEAFEACRFAIETLKKDVPIWKKEVGTDGAEWIGTGS